MNRPSIWDYLPQPEKDCIPPQDREDRQVYTGYWIYYNRDGSVLFGTETREYFGISAGRDRASGPRIRHQLHRVHSLRGPPDRPQGGLYLPERVRSGKTGGPRLAARSHAEASANDATSLAARIAMKLPDYPALSLAKSFVL